MTDIIDELPDKRPLILKLQEKKAGQTRKNLFNPPLTLGRPQKGTKGYEEVMAMDECFKNILSKSLQTGIYSVFPSFVGYGLLSNLSQEALIRAGVETIADDLTRKQIELYYDDDSGNDKEDLINNINSDMKKYKIKDRINTAMLKDGYFGGCLAYIDVGDIDEFEREEPLILDKKTFKAGSFRGLKIIEPVNISPGTYNSTDPTDDNYFNPEWWYIQGKRYHASRFIYFAGNETPLLLKPAYNFFGIPQAQLALDYVANFVANRESAQELLNKFSLTCFGTNMSQGLQQNGSWNDLINRVKFFNKMKTNNGTFVYDKETEELNQINTPLGGVRDIVDMSLNLLTAIWRIPKIRYIGEGEGGLNASSSEQMRSYYDYILAMQEKVLIEPYTKVLKILQLNRGLEPDEKLLFRFPPLWEMDEKERAELNRIQAERDATYLANGVISQEEARQRLSLDKNSGYTMIAVDDVPESTEQPLKDVDKEEQDEEERRAMDMALDGHWITIGAREKGENGENDEGRKGRHIYLDDGETPEEAVKELKKKDNIEKEENKKEGNRIITPAMEYLELLDKEKENSLSEAEKQRKRDLEEKDGFGKESDYFSSKIKECKTIKEAEENARSLVNLSGSVHFSKGNNIKSVNEMNKTIARLMDKYDYHEGFSEYGTNNQRSGYLAHASYSLMEGSSLNLMNLDDKKLAEVYNASVGEWKKRGNEILYFEKKIGDSFGGKTKRYKEVEKKMKFKREIFAHSKEDLIKNIFSHEFGHSIFDKSLKEEIEKGGKIEETILGKTREVSKIKPSDTKTEKLAGDAFKKAKKDGFIYDISFYATKNSHEFFAECFSMRESGYKLPDYIENMLKEITKR